jgi:hypothetical protein
MRNTYLAHDVDISSFAKQKLHNGRMPLTSGMVQRSVAVLRCGVVYYLIRMCSRVRES